MNLIRNIAKKYIRFFTDISLKILAVDGRFYKFLSLYYPNSNPLKRIEFLKDLRKVKIGNKVYIDETVWIDNEHPEFLIIEDNVVVANGARLLTHDSSLNGMYPIPNRVKYTVLKKNCYIGSAAIILPGVTVGEGAIIGAGSVVTKNVPAGEIWAGNPAKKLLSVEEYYNRSQDSEGYSEITEIKDNFTRPQDK